MEDFMIKVLLFTILSINTILGIELTDIYLSGPYGKSLNVGFSKSILDYDNIIWLEKKYEFRNDSYLIKYSFIDTVTGYQFNINNTSLDLNVENIELKLTGGITEEYDFSVSHSKMDNYATIVAFSLLGDAIPDGEGILTELNYLNITSELNAPSNNTTLKQSQNNFIPKNFNFTKMIFADSSGQNISIKVDCYKEKCKDNLYYDEASIDQVILKLNPIDINLWEINYISNIDIYGFQFEIEGVSIKKAYGGESEKNNFMISAKKQFVLAFSFKKDFIPKGQGELIKLEIK